MRSELEIAKQRIICLESESTQKDGRIRSLDILVANQDNSIKNLQECDLLNQAQLSSLRFELKEKSLQLQKMKENEVMKRDETVIQSYNYLGDSN